MLGMLKRHEVEILLKAGHSKAEVARLAGVSLCSVKRIAEEVPVVHVDDAAEREKRRIGRPSIVEDFRKPVAKILEEKPDLPSLEILRRVREAGYQGGKTALYALVASVRPKQIKPLIRFEGLPGEFRQHDFGEVDVTFLVFVYRLTVGAGRRFQIRGLAQLLLHVAVYVIKLNVFWIQAVGSVFAIHPSTSLRLPDVNPIRRPVTGATESACVHEGLQQERPVAIAEFPITGKLACALSQNLAGQSPHTHPRQNQEAAVIHHQLQILRPLFLVPSN